MKSAKSTKSTMSSKGSKSMSSKKPSLKKYEAGAIVSADDKDKGKGKKSTGNKYMNRLSQGIKTVVKDVKDTYKKVEGDALYKLDRICNPNTDVCPYKKGGTVGKYRKK